MALTINTNLSSLRSDREISQKSKTLTKSFERLSSGKRINSAADDAAGLAIADQLATGAATASVAARNISDGVSAASIADGALQSAGDITTRLAELAEQAANGTVGASQRTALNNEYQQLRQELDRISQTTEFNGVKLLSQDSTVTIQAGVAGDSNSQIGLALPGVSASGLGITSDLSSADSARVSLDQIREATQSVASARGQVGSALVQLGSAFENLKTSELNQKDAESRIRDADVASESANAIASKIQLQTAVAVKAQANLQPQITLALLN